MPDAAGEGLFESLGNDFKFAMAKASYNFRNSIKEWMSEVLRVLYEAAALCIDTLRTFNLVVLAISSVPWYLVSPSSMDSSIHSRHG